MTYTEQYNQYVQDWIKENPAFSGTYYDHMLDFDEWIDQYIIEFVEGLYRWDNVRLNNGNWIIGLELKAYTSKEILEIFKKERSL